MIEPNANASNEVLFKQFDGIDQSTALVHKTPGPRKSVHIHRDWDRDGHAFRKGPWKIIVGHHFLPFFFNEVYNETNSWWVIENGNWKDRALQIVQDAMDYLIGRDNNVFVQYLLWMIFDSHNVGGFHRFQNAAGSHTNDLMLTTYKSNLELFKKMHAEDSEYPLVSLFNLEDDPQETTNLANDHPELVEELMKEAENAIKSAPKQWRGDMLHVEALASSQDGALSILRTLGTHFDNTIPFGPYLEDNVDISNLHHERFLRVQRFEIIVIASKVIITYIVMPIFSLIICYKYLVK